MHPPIHPPGIGHRCVRIALAFAFSTGAAHAADIAVPVDGPPVVVSTDKPGQALRFTFRAQAGQHFGLGVMGLKFAPESASGVGFTVKQPDGTLLPGMEMLHCVARNGRACDGQFTVAKSGVHVIETDVPFSAAPRFSVQLSKIETHRITVGKPEAANLSRAGQDARYALEVEKGQDITVELRDIVTNDKDVHFALRVYRSDGSLVGQAHAEARRSASVALGSAAAAGNYIVEIDPDYGATGSFVAIAKAAARSSEGAIEVSSSPGQPLRFAFTASAGQNITVGLDKIVHAPAAEYSNSVLAIVKPDGTRLVGLGCRMPVNLLSPPCRISAAKMEAGDYTIVLTPPPGASVSGRLYRTTDVIGKLVPASATRVELQPGQMARYPLDVAAGEKVGVRIARVSPEDKTLIQVTILGPAGGSGMRALLPAETAAQIEPKELSPGAYTIVVDSRFDKASADISVIR